jgi:hypothetical protein
MYKKTAAIVFFFIALTFLVLPKVFAENILLQYGEISSVYNDEVKLRCKDSMSGDIYYFKFYVGWDTVYEGLGGKDDLNVGDYVNVNYKMDISDKPIATKISLPKDLAANKVVSRSGLQASDADNKEIKEIKDEITKLWAEVNQLKGQLNQTQGT